MNILVIETATAACSVALLDGDTVVAERHDVVGRGHAERLLPLIAELPDGGRAEAIRVDLGPGSFTGIRVGIAAARGLALGWGVAATGYPSTALLARVHRLARGRLVLVGVGGVGSAEQAYAKIRAGASLVQLYAAFAYDGPALIPRLKAGLAGLLRRDGFSSVSQAVGVDAA